MFRYNKPGGEKKRLIKIDWDSGGQIGQGVAIRIGRFPVQTLLDSCLGLETQPHSD